MQVRLNCLQSETGSLQFRGANGHTYQRRQAPALTALPSPGTIQVFRLEYHTQLLAIFTVIEALPHGREEFAAQRGVRLLRLAPVPQATPA